MFLGINGYNQNRNWLVTPSIEVLIQRNYMFRIENSIIEQVDLSSLSEIYNKENHPNYHLKMILRVMIYAYMDNIYFSMKTEKLHGENICNMWLYSKDFPDPKTIVLFLSIRLKSILKEIFIYPKFTHYNKHFKDYSFLEHLKIRAPPTVIFYNFKKHILHKNLTKKNIKQTKPA